MLNSESVDLLDLVARDVLEQNYVSGPAVLTPHAGGFSGARVWYLRCAGEFCLRVWPSREPGRERLHEIHRWMTVASAAGLTFVPALLPARSGATWVEHAGRFWEVTTWLPGQADFHAQPSQQRLEAACASLALLHNSWGTDPGGPRPCPAVHRRLDVANDWIKLLDSGWNLISVDWPPEWARDDLVGSWSGRAWQRVQRHIRDVPARLAPWLDKPMQLRPCLCDIWHDHVLFTGDRVTGIIDYGSMKIDHVTVDLARLLGSLVGDDAESHHRGLAAYRNVRALSLEEEALMQVLDETGAVIGIANWLKWLHRDRRRYADSAAVARKLGQLVERVEQWR